MSDYEKRLQRLEELITTTSDQGDSIIDLIRKKNAEMLLALGPDVSDMSEEESAARLEALMTATRLKVEMLKRNNPAMTEFNPERPIADF